MAECDAAASGNERATPRLVTPKGTKSILWKHFGFQVDDKGEYLDKKAVRCRLCERSIAYSGNTTNLRQHLQLHHQEVFGEPGPSTSARQATLGDVGVKPNYNSVPSPLHS